MKKYLEVLILQSLETLISQGVLSNDLVLDIKLDHTKDKQHGDFACNIAMTLAKIVGMPPRKLAEKIIENLPSYAGQIEKIEIAGPGFINFFLSNTAWHREIGEILSLGSDYGHSRYGLEEKINLEFVSSNPTGPLHVGHGRSAAYGAATANLLAAIGYHVHREYYVNDAGRQMDILATSIWLRYLELCHEEFPFPVNGYKGEYVSDIAVTLKKQHGDALHWPAQTLFQDIPPDEPQGGDKEQHIDALIEKCQSLLGDTTYRQLFDLGLHVILSDIKNDLEEFGVIFDEWFSERSLYENGYLENCIAQLKNAGYTYEKEGNVWFSATTFGDEKDRVLIRKNGKPTYFAADVANHLGKFTRGADRLINIFGSDHHGYVARIHAALEALGYDREKLQVPLVQFVTLFRGTERVQMSTRSGSFVTLRELREDVGNDAARFFYILRKSEQHLEFDLELAKSHSSDNPVYYIQYAHARICSIFRQLTEKKLRFDEAEGLKNLDILTTTHEKKLTETLARFPEVIHTAAIQYEPHLLAHYLKDLACDFHTYYNAHQFLVEDGNVRNARLCLAAACQQVIKNGLTLLGVCSPETM